MKKKNWQYYLKLGLINLLVLLALLVVVNLIIIGGFTAQRLQARYKPPHNTDARAKLPNYQGIPWAATYFDEDGGIEIRYYSHYSWRRKSFHGKTINISEEGIRHTPQPPAATPEKPLVALLGGSTMWGVGSNDENTIPALLAAAGEGRFRTANFAEVGYDAYQSSLFLHQQLLKGVKPAVVISYDGVNNKFFQGRDDFSDFYENDIRDAVEKARIKQEDRLTFRNWFLKPLEIIAGKLKGRMRPAQENPPLVTLTPQMKEKKARELLEGWLATANICEQNGIRFLAILQPNAFTGTPKVDHLQLSPQIRNDLSYYTAVLQLMDEPRYAKVKQHFADFTHVFDGRFVYIDFCHTSPTGNKELASALLAWLNNQSI